METSPTPDVSPLLAGLNDAQRRAVVHDDGPLLIVAGAGSGKTKTLAHRVAYLIHCGTPPERVCLLTFTRRAAAEMLRRVDALLLHTDVATRAQTAAPHRRPRSAAVWGGTFHATANRLLRIYAKAIGLDPNFTVLDRGDAEDLMNVCRNELGLADRRDKRAPRKSTCLDIYSRCVNACADLPTLLDAAYPWCRDFADELRQLFALYVDRKEQQAVFDYDDLLLFWHHLMQDEAAAGAIRSRFDHVLVDEYQDTNFIQARILESLRPGGRGLTVVGDDAQSIYSFRAATVRNILDFPQQYPGTTVVTLEQNYRSTSTILDATNAVIAQAAQRYVKHLWSTRRSQQRPWLVVCEDEDEQSDYVLRSVLELREQGIDLQRQAVLFRAAYHSDALEVELTRRNVPYVKYGGLRFLEAAHVKDLLAFLRIAENPRDQMAATRLLHLLPGIGPSNARRALTALAEQKYDLRTWATLRMPAAAREAWAAFTKLLTRLASPSAPELPAQILLVREFYEPHLEQRFDNAMVRLRDLEQLEQIASRFADRATFLADLTLDPPTSTSDLAGPPLLDEDYLILSTIHSAKGCEWDAVYVIHAADGCIPSDMATGDAEDIEEELRLFYVALTRARDSLHVCFPLRYYHRTRRAAGKYTFANPTRFLPDDIRPLFETRAAAFRQDSDTSVAAPIVTTESIRAKIKRMWH